MPQEGHLDQVYPIFGYLKGRKKLRILLGCGNPKISENRFKTYDWQEFNMDAREVISPKMPEVRGLPVSISCSVEADLDGNRVIRRSQTEVLISVNKASIHWYSKRQPTVESSTFGLEFYAMKTAVEML